MKRCLEAAGCRVAYDARQTCCGQPAYNMGHHDEARTVAGRVLALYAGTQGPIVVPSGSCAAMMSKEYPHLFHGTPHAEPASAFAARVVEWSRFLVSRGHQPAVRSDAAPVAVHHSCHGMRELGLRDEAVVLLERAGVPVVPLRGADECCGFGGAFSVLLPEMSGRILETKLANVHDAVAAGATEIVSLDAGCLMQMQGGHERAWGCKAGEAGCPRYRHVAEVLADGLGRSGDD